MGSGGDCHFDCITRAKMLKIHGMNIGDGMLERLKSGQVNNDRIYNYEKRWTEKLKIIDENHTSKHKITELEVGRILCRIGKFFEADTPSICPNLKQKVLSCLEENNETPDKCKSEVSNFTNCIKSAILKIGLKCSPDYLETKSASYKDRFERGIIP